VKESSIESLKSIKYNIEPARSLLTVGLCYARNCWELSA